MDAVAGRRVVAWGTISLLVLLLSSCGGGESEPRVAARPEEERSATRSRSAADTAGTRERLRRTIEWLADAGGHRSRVALTAGNDWSVAEVAQQMRLVSSDVRFDTAVVPLRGGGSGRLLTPIATIAGSTDTTIVICAHIDASASRDGNWGRAWRRAVAPGADDNASGVAALLELFRRAAARAERPRYRLLFAAVNGEEFNPGYALPRRDGHHVGSRSLARSLKKEGGVVRGVIVLDMIGRVGNAMPVFSSRGSRWLADSLATIAATMEKGIRLDPTVGTCTNSDNESFDRLGIPAVLIMQSCRPWRRGNGLPANRTYHTARDLPGEIDLDVVEQVTTIVDRFLR